MHIGLSKSVSILVTFLVGSISIGSNSLNEEDNNAQKPRPCAEKIAASVAQLAEIRDQVNGAAPVSPTNLEAVTAKNLIQTESLLKHELHPDGGKAPDFGLQIRPYILAALQARDIELIRNEDGSYFHQVRGFSAVKIAPSTKTKQNRFALLIHQLSNAELFYSPELLFNFNARASYALSVNTVHLFCSTGFILDADDTPRIDLDTLHEFLHLAWDSLLKLQKPNLLHGSVSPMEPNLPSALNRFNYIDLDLSEITNLSMNVYWEALELHYRLLRDPSYFEGHFAELPEDEISTVKTSSYDEDLKRLANTLTVARQALQQAETFLDHFLSLLKNEDSFSFTTQHAFLSAYDLPDSSSLGWVQIRDEKTNAQLLFVLPISVNDFSLLGDEMKLKTVRRRIELLLQVSRENLSTLVTLSEQLDRASEAKSYGAMVYTLKHAEQIWNLNRQHLPIDIGIFRNALALP